MVRYQDPNFDKKKYWERRQLGLRGLDTIRFSKRGIIYTRNGIPVQAEVGGKPVGKKALRKNTKRARKAAMNVT